MTHRVHALRSPQFGEIAARGKMVVLLPLGSVEPHGPHLGLGTDQAISDGAARAAIPLLKRKGYEPVVAPSIPYGVTDCAAGFPGAVSVPAEVLTPFVRATALAYLAEGASHVCLVNNHLEPAQDAAIRAAADGEARISVACPLTRRWGRTLSAEFKSGACHAGEYETSIVLACEPALVDQEAQSRLRKLDISLSEGLRDGKSTFSEMGMTEAYTGDPSAANSEEGKRLLKLLATMIVTVVVESLSAEQ